VFNEEKAIKYRSTWIAVIVGMVFTILSSLFLRYDYIRDNRKRDAIEPAQTGPLSGEGNANLPADVEKDIVTEIPLADMLARYTDQTDKQRKSFRYVY
jgi:hypothetical protein